jgi:hypothetical protein
MPSVPPPAGLPRLDVAPVGDASTLASRFMAWLRREIAQADGATVPPPASEQVPS